MNAWLDPFGDSEALGHGRNAQTTAIKVLVGVFCDAFNAAIGFLQKERVDVVGLGKEVVQRGIRIGKPLFVQLDEAMALSEQRVPCPIQLGRMRQLVRIAHDTHPSSAKDDGDGGWDVTLAGLVHDGQCKEPGHERKARTHSEIGDRPERKMLQEQRQ